MPDDLFLRAPKARQAEHGIQDGESVRGDAGFDVTDWGDGGNRHAV
jgi:hypothetical protein